MYWVVFCCVFWFSSLTARGHPYHESPYNDPKDPNNLGEHVHFNKSDLGIHLMITILMYLFGLRYNTDNVYNLTDLSYSY